MTIKAQKIDVRVSTIPIQYGESLVMRLLNKSDVLIDLSALGIADMVLKNFRRALHASYGLILIVGPTGSGKTTSLYAGLNELNEPGNKIITVEDPVEYRLERINQIQVNSQIELTFLTVLRAILRQDPDIIMIGEIRDKDTLEIAIRAAMTGHLVLATLHTNDTYATLTRLIDMGAESYLIASVLRAVMEQRLVRRLCVHCSVVTPVTENFHAFLNAAGVDWKNQSYKTSAGCSKCHHTGYLGRIGVYELLLLNEGIYEALRENRLNIIKDMIQSDADFKSLLNGALQLAAQGQTSLEEVMSMAGEI